MEYWSFPAYVAELFNLRENGRPKTGKGPLELPSRIKISEDFCKLLGFFANRRKGRSRGCRIRPDLGKREREYASELQMLLKNVFGVESAINEKGDAMRVEVPSKLFATMLAETLRQRGITCGERISKLVHVLPDKFRIAFLQGYATGDENYVMESETNNSSILRPPIFTSPYSGDRASSLCLQLAVGGRGFPSNGWEGELRKKFGLRNNTSTASPPKTDKRFSTLMGYVCASENPRREQVGSSAFCGNSIKVVKPLLEYLRVSSIRKVKPTNEYAYDISVPNFENFLGGTGGIFLHNTIHDKGLSTTIDWRDKRVTGKKLAPTQRMELYRLRKWQRRVRVSDATERNLAVALSELSKLASILSLPKNILEPASVIYRRAIKRRLIRGRSIQTVTAAAIYLSCRQCGVPRTLDEIATVASMSKKDVGRSYRFLVRELGTYVPSSTSRHYASRFSNKLITSGKAEVLALKILETAKGLKLTSGRGPTGIAAAATYIATVLTNERKTQREIAEIANVTEVTIRNRYKELMDKILFEVSL